MTRPRLPLQSKWVIYCSRLSFVLLVIFKLDEAYLFSTSTSSSSSSSSPSPRHSLSRTLSSILERKNMVTPETKPVSFFSSLGVGAGVGVELDAGVGLRVNSVRNFGGNYASTSPRTRAMTRRRTRKEISSSFGIKTSVSSSMCESMGGESSFSSPLTLSQKRPRGYSNFNSNTNISIPNKLKRMMLSAAISSKQLFGMNIDCFRMQSQADKENENSLSA